MVYILAHVVDRTSSEATSHTKPVMLVYAVELGAKLRTIHHAAKIGAHLFTAM